MDWASRTKSGFLPLVLWMSPQFAGEGPYQTPTGRKHELSFEFATKTRNELTSCKLVIMKQLGKLIVCPCLS